MSSQYTKESIQYGELNDRGNAKASTYITDELLNSQGLYSKKDINNAKFNKYSRFGRVLDPYGRLNGGREYLFFVKPDLHICIPYGKSQSDTLYTFLIFFLLLFIFSILLISFGLSLLISLHSIIQDLIHLFFMTMLFFIFIIRIICFPLISLSFI